NRPPIRWPRAHPRRHLLQPIERHNMTSSPAKTLSLPNLGALRNLLNLLASLRDLSNPFASIENLRATIQLLINFGGTIGFDLKWLAWLQSIGDNPELLNLVLAAGQFLEKLFDKSQSPSATARRHAHAPDMLAINWLNLLGLVSQILKLLE